ncbi:MAG: hypothetical protein MJ198_09325 [Bacteroidales bacterium]|nr:hypothetical protein [Bacteroidales bacterium]
MKRFTLLLIFLIGFSLLSFSKVPQTNNHGFVFENKCVEKQTGKQQSFQNETGKIVVSASMQDSKRIKSVKSKSSVVKQSERKIENVKVNEIVQNSIESKAFSCSNNIEKPTKSNHFSGAAVVLLALFYLFLIGMIVGGIFALCTGRIWLGIVLTALPFIKLVGIILSEVYYSSNYYIGFV